MNKTNKGLVEFAKSKLGCPYWYGTFGNIATDSLLSAKTKQYPQFYTADRIARCKTQMGKEVFDCVGLVKGYLWQSESGKIVYDAKTDKSANGMLETCTQKGSIETMPSVPGLLVFMNGHVGVYIGNGEAVEATVYQNSYQVIKTKIQGRGWTSWGKCPYITYENSSEGKDTQMKQGDQNIGVYAYKKLLGAFGYSLDNNHIFGKGTENATKGIQKELKVPQTGIADEKVINGLYQLVVSKQEKLKGDCNKALSKIESAKKALS